MTNDNNKSFHEGCFPGVLKLAKVIPIHKEMRQQTLLTIGQSALISVSIN